MARLRKSALAFDAITLEGSLISPAKLSEVADRRAGEQTEADYHIPKGLTLRDETARYFRIAQALFRDLFTSPNPSHSYTIRFTHELLRDVFGFADIEPVVGQKIKDGRDYIVHLEVLQGRVPVVVVPPSDDLDHASSHLSHDRRRSAAMSLQDWLNADDNSLWGLCCNGERLRLLRDNQSLTRPAYIEANLRQLFEAEDYAGFAALWLMFHSSRFGRPHTPASDCALERWREAGNKEGLAARERLSLGVKEALLTLGNGFLAHPTNSALRDRLAQGNLPLAEFFNELLRVVYRLIFLLVAEDRDLLHLPNATPDQRQLYTRGYSVSSLRDRSIRRSGWDEFHDRWEGLLIVFNLLVQGEPRLGLPGLGGLFDGGTTKNINQARLANRALMEAIFRLAWLRTDSTLMPVNWRDMETEELGSVYEGLLELTPRLTADGRGFAFADGAESKGNERKKTGSYYTPDSLVQALLDSALDPVLDRVEKEAEDAPAALVSLSVIDPACGSGHFLLAAARRIATRIARLRTGGVPSAADYRHALRDAVRCCIHGVDRNPMAVELAKVALWIESVEPGKPLGFLDVNIRLGDSLLGIFDLTALEKGIPDAAYKPLAGDDRATANDFLKRNRSDKGVSQDVFDFTGGGTRARRAMLPDLAASLDAVRQLPEDSVNQVEAKRAQFRAVHSDARLTNLEQAADLYIAAFLTSKTESTSLDLHTSLVPTTDDVWKAMRGSTVYGPRLGASRAQASRARAFHWPLEFADIFERGGFDVVLGNPPWERIKIQEQEFFASREPEIAEAPNKAARARLIAALQEAQRGTREYALFEEFEGAKRVAEASSEFARVEGENGGRFPLTGKGDVNTYSLFAELFIRLRHKFGSAGVIVPTGIAFDVTNRSFFNAIFQAGQLRTLISFYEVRQWFQDTDDRKPFCLLSVASACESPRFIFDVKDLGELLIRARWITLTLEEISLVNPKTQTAPVFLTQADAELTSKVYRSIPALVSDTPAWKIGFMAMFHMANASHLFVTSKDLAERGLPTRDYSPLIEAKMAHVYDHRWSTYEGGSELRACTTEEHQDPNYETQPRYWVAQQEIERRLAEKGWTRAWLLGWRDIVGSEGRTLIPSIVPRFAVNDKLLLLLPRASGRKVAALYACLASMTCDYLTKQKVGGSSLKNYVMEQLPVLPESAFPDEALDFIVPRVLELTYTSHSISGFARELGYEGGPFGWDENRRALLRSELDAWFARAYGLTRDELRYILDPADIMGPQYPSETFRVLKDNEMRRFREYRTQRLVLAAWDRMEAGDLPAPAPYDRNATALEAVAGVNPLFGAGPLFEIPEAAPAMPPTYIAPSMLPDNSWAMPAYNSISVQLQLAALLKKLPGPTPADKIRLAALYALRPDYFTPQLSGAERNEWERLVGNSSRASNAINVIKFVPRVSIEWRDAYTQLRGMHALVEDSDNNTWTPGSAVQDFQTEGWPDGRAGFVLKMLEGMDIGRSITMLPTDVQAWVRGYAA